LLLAVQTVIEAMLKSYVATGPAGRVPSKSVGVSQVTGRDALAIYPSTWVLVLRVTASFAIKKH
jgi:hypothetical protein